ncbi:MAG: Altronate dehydratase [uncultured Rubrobacteraceae bacterium]|uniref:Altronate dehydratase n=1 Tax=uncultured Rubrobacteraceae bacterium TaxID=349277 RepID=A0A6J4TTB7_9ACTN|nr:MAG: Altronate dehydratase [uncultured Rubrobacteraceae bacterium]
MDPSKDRFDFDEVGRLPAPGDNVAIATRRLEAGTRVSYGDGEFEVPHTVLEGHRFAVEPVREGEDLFSWGLPFGRALVDISPGDYACNEKILRVLRERFGPTPAPSNEDPEGTSDQGGGRVPGGFRKAGLDLPEGPNFRDAELEPYVLDEEDFTPGEQVPLREEPRTFTGYRRGGGRGVGTRNYVVVLGVNSRLTGFVRALEWEMNGVSDAYENIDGIVCVAHTEGGEGRTPNNLDLLLRTLSGFMVNPNVGAVLAIDGGDEGAVANGALRRYAEGHGYPLDGVTHEFMSLEGSFRADLERAKAQVTDWLEDVNAARRTEEPLSELKIGLQCGGSDAFSGVSANPLVGWVSGEVVRNGGAANLAETDELIGAERYVLKNVRDAETARRFLGAVERFKERVGWHGHTAEDNPSGGNNLRGLYNISIKSIGAARKKDPAVRVDRVIEYAEPMRGGGFYFMDSPGNDLESVAGQVASGANMIFFTTGNGSITNFPFVPTIKVVTTTGRYELLSKDMDVNAGAYLDGVPMDELGREMFERTIAAASGEKTVGERAGHAQVSIWRDWKRTGPEGLEELENAPEPDGEPLPVRGDAPGVGFSFEAIETGRGPVTDQVGLVMPTSLCSGQIARRIANRLNEGDAGFALGKVTRFVALPHTEGCGVSAGSAEAIYSRTVLGYLANPTVRLALLLEHGCEKTHNDYFENRLAERGLDRDRFGWASVQLDGGIESVVEKVESWFSESLEASEDLEYTTAGPGALRLGLYASGPLPDEAARSLAETTLAVVGAGGTVVVPETAAVLGSRAYLDAVLGEHPVRTTLSYGQAFERPGFHVMEAPTDHWIETATGLGATGVEVMLAHVSGRPLQAHRMIPLAQASSDPETLRNHADDLDALLDGDPETWTEGILETLSAVASREHTPKLFAANNTDFQFTRGLLGVSM